MGLSFPRHLVDGIKDEEIENGLAAADIWRGVLGQALGQSKERTVMEVRFVGGALESSFIDHMVTGCIFMKPSDLVPLKIDSIPIQTAPGTLDLHDMEVSSVARGRPLKKDRHHPLIFKVKPEMCRHLVLNIEHDAVRHGLTASGKSDPRGIDADLHRITSHAKSQ